MAKVLVVDDEKPIVDLISDLIEDSGHQALKAYNGRDALEIARREMPVLIISDLMMPLLDGFDLLTAVRTESSLKNTIFVMMSAAFVNDVMRRDPKADQYLAKPFDLDTIDGLISKLSGTAPDAH